MSESDFPAEFWQGIQQFNQGEFYECHDTLEAIWIEASEPQKTFYQGILQLAVAIYHLGNHNLRGATILVGEAISRLSRYQPNYAGIDVIGLLDESQTLLRQLQQATLENVNLPQLLQEGGLQYPKISLLETSENSDNL
ncbi:DUF309 domain-containing protein [Desertifilum tharense IPPAS B-1220]|uniref:DUF309 domain-containing protein n=1 Tax=Desertifilum tharense IPPAS B-1220 TaxID=1781255 RepID=A0A1E5QJX3_9CYAN|nr:DUF309 domain-containing protein [Desertifilum tharense]OEJ74960.1 hypothetical protein BH720_12115 [Desertifilum tharense IPPAS B-1220]